MTAPLMPKATAVWLIDNTALTFDQIALFCGLHPLEVRGIADGDVASGIKGLDPISTGQLTREEIERCQNDTTAILKLTEKKSDIPAAKPRSGSKYTPLSKRQERPDAIAWLVRNHSELTDAQIGRLVGTTKTTIVSVRDRTHWNMTNIKPVDPVSLGLCSQIELDEAVALAARRVERQRKAAERAARKAGATLQSADETTGSEFVAADMGSTDTITTDEAGQNTAGHAGDIANSDAYDDASATEDLSADDVFSNFSKS